MVFSQQSRAYVMEQLAGLKIPTERGFKGISIIFTMYAIGNFLALALVTSLTTAHLNKDGLHPKDISEETIEERRKVLWMTLLIIGSICAAIALFAFTMKIRYAGKNGLSAEDIKRNKELARGEQADLISNRSQ